MDIPVLAAALILAVIAAAEIILLLRCPKVRPFPLMIMIRSSSHDIDNELQYLAYLLDRNDGTIGKIVILSDSADKSKNAVCARFAEKFNESAIFIKENDENFLQKVIDFSEEI